LPNQPSSSSEGASCRIHAELLPKIAAAATYLTTVLRHLEEQIG
jgi:hypothetical protein